MPNQSQRDVTAASTDEEIIAAIEAAGEYKYHWRPRDWAKPGDNNPKSWVIPNDIGWSSRREQSLLRRLHKMAEKGLLERRYTSSRDIPQLNWRCITLHGIRPTQTMRGMPRFRVAKGALPDR